MYNDNTRRLKGGLLTLLILIFMTAGSAGALTVNLAAGQIDLSMPDGTVVPAWGFGLNGGPIKVPGDPIVIPPDETILTINLTNNLVDEPVSLQIVGQILSPNPNGPVWTDTDTSGNPVTFTGSRPAGNFKARVRSFSHETAPGATASYTWNNFKPGTYLLTSATNPAKQVQMGLYAAVKQDAAAGNVAYDGMEPYDKELIIVFHELDPAIHAAIDAGNYGAGSDPLTGGIPSSIRREPTYFLINGMAHPDAGLDPINAAVPIKANERVLLRFVNAGYNTHVPQLLNLYMTTVAEDGRPYAYSKAQYGYELAAGKTMDAIVVPTGGKFPIYDAILNLSNAGAAPGGMLAYVTVNSCVSDIEPAGGDGDVDGLDIFAFDPASGDPAVLAGEFGRTDCLPLP